jgi:hypothetical protein
LESNEYGKGSEINVDNGGIAVIGPEDDVDVEFRGLRTVDEVDDVGAGIGTMGTIGDVGNECDMSEVDDGTGWAKSRGMYSKP